MAMRLLIRGQDIAWTSIGLSDQKGAVIHSCRVDSRPETILNAVVAALADWGVGAKAIDSLGVVSGTGSFTALRSSLTISNALAFTRGIPLASVEAEQGLSDAVVFGTLAKARANKGWITPAYGAEAHITQSKKTKGRSSSV